MPISGWVPSLLRGGGPLGRGPWTPWPLGPWASGPLGPWTPWPLGPWASGPLDPLAPEPLSNWAPGPLGPWAPWAPAPLGLWAPGPLGTWAPGPLRLWAPGPLRPYTLASGPIGPWPLGILCARISQLPLSFSVSLIYVFPHSLYLSGPTEHKDPAQHEASTTTPPRTRTPPSTKNPPTTKKAKMCKSSMDDPLLAGGDPGRSGKCKSSMDDPLLAKALGAGVLPKVQKKGSCKVTMASTTLPNFPRSPWSRWAKGPKPPKPRAKSPKPQKPHEESPKPPPQPPANPKPPRPLNLTARLRLAPKKEPWWDLPLERPSLVMANARSYILAYPKGMEKKFIVEITHKQSRRFEQHIKHILERIRADVGYSKSWCRALKEMLLDRIG